MTYRGLLSLLPPVALALVDNLSQVPLSHYEEEL